jgi:MbtH protein
VTGAPTPPRLFYVVVNDEEQYSIWPSAVAVPGGWRVCSVSATEDACVELVERLWIDMTPKSLRDRGAPS